MLLSRVRSWRRDPGLLVISIPLYRLVSVGKVGGSSSLLMWLGRDGIEMGWDGGMGDGWDAHGQGMDRLMSLRRLHRRNSF